MQPMTSFQLVSQMNEKFGNPKGNPHKINGARLLSQCKNITKEYEELMLAISLGDINKIRDALCDIQVFAMGAQHFMGYDGDRDMRSVVEALYSRFCRDQPHLVETMVHFNNLGVEYYREGEFPFVCLKSSFDQGDGEYPKGKFLKAVGYSEPIFYEADLEIPVYITKDKAAEIMQNMAEQRATETLSTKKKLDLINKQVEEYRNHLEKEAFGFEPFNPEGTTSNGRA